MFNFLTRSHEATVTHDYAKVSKERMVNRIKNITVALKGLMPKEKKTKLKQELRGMLSELDAREETINQIMKDL